MSKKYQKKHLRANSSKISSGYSTKAELLNRTHYLTYRYPPRTSMKMKPRAKRSCTPGDDMSAEGVLAVYMAPNIAQVARMEVDPLYLMFGMDDVLDILYLDMAKIGNIHNLTNALP